MYVCVTLFLSWVHVKNSVEWFRETFFLEFYTVAFFSLLDPPRASGWLFKIHPILFSLPLMHVGRLRGGWGGGRGVLSFWSEIWPSNWKMQEGVLMRPDFSPRRRRGIIPTQHHWVNSHFTAESRLAFTHTPKKKKDLCGSEKDK